MSQKNTSTPTGSVHVNPPLHEKIKKLFADYGLLAICGAILVAYVSFVWQVTGVLVQRADNQAVANEKIGILEGKMEILLQDRLDLLKLYYQKIASDSSNTK